MFETLFSCSAVLRRHRKGPFAAERAAYLQGLAARGAARDTLLWELPPASRAGAPLVAAPSELCGEEPDPADENPRCYRLLAT